MQSVPGIGWKTRDDINAYKKLAGVGERPINLDEVDMVHNQVNS